MSVPPGDERTTQPSVTAAPSEPDHRPRSRAVVVATALVLVVIGLELGYLGGFLTLSAPRVLGVSIPVGPLVGLLGNLAVGRWVVQATGVRATVVALAVGWLVAVVPLSTTRAEGDLVITNDGKGLAFLLLGALAWLVASLLVRSPEDPPPGR